MSIDEREAATAVVRDCIVSAQGKGSWASAADLAAHLVELERGEGPRDTSTTASIPLSRQSSTGPSASTGPPAAAARNLKLEESINTVTECLQAVRNAGADVPVRWHAIASLANSSLELQREAQRRLEPEKAAQAAVLKAWELAIKRLWELHNSLGSTCVAGPEDTGSVFCCKSSKPAHPRGQHCELYNNLATRLGLSIIATLRLESTSAAAGPGDSIWQNRSLPILELTDGTVIYPLPATVGTAAPPAQATALAPATTVPPGSAPALVRTSESTQAASAPSSLSAEDAIKVFAELTRRLSEAQHKGEVKLLLDVMHAVPRSAWKLKNANIDEDESAAGGIASIEVYTAWLKRKRQGNEAQVKVQAELLSGMLNTVVTAISIYLAFLAVVYQGMLGLDRDTCNLVWSPICLYSIGGLVSAAAVVTMLWKAKQLNLILQQTIMIATLDNTPGTTTAASSIAGAATASGTVTAADKVLKLENESRKKRLKAASVHAAALKAALMLPSSTRKFALYVLALLAVYGSLNAVVIASAIEWMCG